MAIGRSGKFRGARAIYLLMMPAGDLKILFIINDIDIDKTRHRKLVDHSANGIAIDLVRRENLRLDPLAGQHHAAGVIAEIPWSDEE